MEDSDTLNKTGHYHCGKVQFYNRSQMTMCLLIGCIQQKRELGIHIGNAVPVELGRAIGISIQKHIEEYERKSNHDRERNK